jgi:3-oxoacyl-[acyl-carrier protein] reductase
MKLENRVALVTGGGSGIGRAISIAFAREGAIVVVNDLHLVDAERTLDEIEQAHANALAADISNSDEVGRMFEEVARRLGRLDILVNNAGIAEPPERWAELNRIAEARLEELAAGKKIGTHWNVTAEMSDNTWRRMMQVHLDGAFFCTRAALEPMKRQNGGAIINMSSTAAIMGLPDAPHYSAAKAGILGLTRSVAREVGAWNIRVNAIAPGFVETPMTAHISTDVKASSLKRIPMGRWATPEDIAASALFLASDDAAYITGQCLSPNGGMV